MKTIATVTIIVLLIIPTIALAKESESTRYNKGFNDACNGGEMAPGPHTQAYLDGFNAGLTCGDGSSSPSPSSSGNPNCKAFCVTR